MSRKAILLLFFHSGVARDPPGGRQYNKVKDRKENLLQIKKLKI